MITGNDSNWRVLIQSFRFWNISNGATQPQRASHSGASETNETVGKTKSVLIVVLLAKLAMPPKKVHKSQQNMLKSPVLWFFLALLCVGGAVFLFAIPIGSKALSFFKSDYSSTPPPTLRPVLTNVFPHDSQGLLNVDLSNELKIRHLISLLS